ncbi:MAG: serine/threonine protein kinase [Myxococcales bacterium]|nr:serine/threonine protein kinase [Myxococcales bacterium]
METDRRQFPRQSALIKALAEVDGHKFDVVCTDIGPGGGYCSARVATSMGKTVEIAMRPKGANSPTVLVAGEVVYAHKGGGTRPQGFGVRWVKATSRTGPDALERLLREVLGIRPQSKMVADPLGVVVFDFVAFHATRTWDPPPAAPAPAQRPAGPVPTVTDKDSLKAHRAGGPALQPATPGPGTARQSFSASPTAQPATPVNAYGRTAQGGGALAGTAVPPDAWRAPQLGEGPAIPGPWSMPQPEPKPKEPPAPVRPARDPSKAPTPYVWGAPANPNPPTPPQPRPGMPPGAVLSGAFTPHPQAAPNLLYGRSGGPPTPTPGPAQGPVPRPAPRPPQPQLQQHTPAPRAADEVGFAGSMSDRTVFDTSVPHARPTSTTDVGSREAQRARTSQSSTGVLPTTPREELKAPLPPDAWPVGVPKALSSRYDRLEHLGQGGNGIVFRAVDVLLDRFVVLKFMAQGALSSDLARRYFLREVKLAAGLSHPNIVHIYDLGNAEGVLYYAMEYVEGRPMTDYLFHNEPMADWSFAYSILAQLAEALDFAHSQGVLHRDVKPDNVLISSDGVVKLFDFGLARAYGDGFADKSMLVGTPHYMAPEQFTSGTVDSRTDLYALGVLAYRVLAGRLPFRDSNVFVGHAMEAPPDPRSFNLRLPQGVEAALGHMLAKKPADRPDRCREAIAGLYKVLFAT